MMRPAKWRGHPGLACPDSLLGTCTAFPGCIGTHLCESRGPGCPDPLAPKGMLVSWSSTVGCLLSARVAQTCSPHPTGRYQAQVSSWTHQERSDVLEAPGVAVDDEQRHRMWVPDVQDARHDVVHVTREVSV